MEMEMEMEMAKPTSDCGVDRKMGDAHRGFLLTQIVLRTLVVAFTMAAIVITVTARQSVSLFGLVLDARYKYSSAMRFQVGANVVVCTFCFFVWMFLLRMFTIPSSNPKFNSHNSFHLLLHDLVMTTLSISGCAAGTTVGYLAKYGEKHNGWTPVCDYVNKFCNMEAVALGFSYLAFIVLFLLTIIAAYKLNSHTTHRIAGDT